MAATNSNRLVEPILVVRDATKRFGNVMAGATTPCILHAFVTPTKSGGYP